MARHQEKVPDRQNTEPLVFHETVEKDHGRLEVRRYWQSGELGWFAGRGEWEGLRSVGVVESVRQVGEGRPGIERRYCLGSLGVDVERFARAVRGHWAIENSLHPLPEAFKKLLKKISPAQIDRLLRPSRVQHPKKGLCATRPGTLLRHEVPTRGGPPDTTRPGSVEADTVAHCDDSTEGDYVNSLTFTELYSGWTENRAVWNKSAESVLVQLKELESVVPYAMKDFHTDNGGEFLNWALHRHLTGRSVPTPWTRSRAHCKNDNAHCEQKNWTHVRQLFGHDRSGHAELVPLMNDLYAREWSQFTNHFKPTFRLLKREKNGKTRRIYEKTPCTPYQRLLESAEIPEAAKTKLRAQHATLDPFALKKSIEEKLKKFFTAQGNLDRESTKT